jgi:predicted transcriptional regulator
MLTENLDPMDRKPHEEPTMNIDPANKPVEQIGPLQLRVMHYIWKHGPSTVQTVMTALNNDAGSRPLAYTTFLTVMRNLARRNLLEQKKTSQRSHMFSAAIGEDDYKTAFIKQVFRDYFSNDVDALLRYLGHGERVSH